MSLLTRLFTPAPGAAPRRPPTFAPGVRCCANCDHFLAKHCRHPQAEWGWGLLNNRDMRLRRPENRWPAKDPMDWCGFWRPASSGERP